MKILLLVLVAALLLVSGCVQYGKQTPQAETQQPQAATGAAKEFTIHEDSFKFDTPTITVKKGDAVKITVINDNGLHNFAIPDFNVRTQAKTASTQAIQFTADKSGEFAYYCEVNGHRSLGMEGKLIVQ